MFRKLFNIFLSLLVLVGIASGVVWYANKKIDEANMPTANLTPKFTNHSMKITSPVFNDSDFIPLKYTCDGEDISPPLTIQSVPPETKSLVLVVDDTYTNSVYVEQNWTHWMVYDLDALTTSIPEGAIFDKAQQGMNDFKQAQYNGPCPPQEEHPYEFRLYALDTYLDLPPGLRKETLELQMSNHVVAIATLVGRYQKQ